MLLFVTFVSIAVAVVAVTMAWQMVRRERRRSDARVAALMEGAASETEAATASPADTGAWLEWPPPDETAVVNSEPPRRTSVRELFAPASDVRATPAFRGLVAGVLIVAGSAFALWLAGSDAGGATASAPDAPPPALELVALSHERRGDELTIRGLVRNPAAGTSLDSTQTVVSFFDARGRFLSSARAPLEIRNLVPGGESAFLLTTAAPADLGRYRLSFRREEGGLVPHVDRRAHP